MLHDCSMAGLGCVSLHSPITSSRLLRMEPSRLLATTVNSPLVSADTASTTSTTCNDGKGRTPSVTLVKERVQTAPKGASLSLSVRAPSHCQTLH